MDHRTMREFLLDAAEAVWWIITLPIRRVAADAMEDVLDRHEKTTESPAFKWSDNDTDETELPLQRPPARSLAERLGLIR